MNITIYTEPAQFLADAEQFLYQNPVANNLQISLSLALQKPDHHYTLPVLMAIVRDDVGIVLATLMTPPHPLNLSLLRPDANQQQVLELLVQTLKQHDWQPTEALATPEIALNFAQLWSQATNQSFTIKRHERLYELTQVTPRNYTAGRLRQATMDDCALITAWIKGFAADAIEPISDEEALTFAQRRIIAQEVYLWLVDDQPVSMAAWGRPMPPWVTVSLVYTPPELRKHGYASALVARLSQHLIDTGYSNCMLYTDLANPTSNAIYQQIGYRPIVDMDQYAFGVDSKQ